MYSYFITINYAQTCIMVLCCIYGNNGNHDVSQLEKCLKECHAFDPSGELHNQFNFWVWTNKLHNKKKHFQNLQVHTNQSLERKQSFRLA
jgi:endonuclease IV